MTGWWGFAVVALHTKPPSVEDAIAAGITFLVLAYLWHQGMGRGM